MHRVRLPHLLRPLHPAHPLQRARHRGWIEYASTCLNDIAALYAAEAPTFPTKLATLTARLSRLEGEVQGPYFAPNLSLVDAAFGPVFRYFEVFQMLDLPDCMPDTPQLTRWRQELQSRPSVAAAVGTDYPERLAAFLRARSSHLGDGARASQNLRSPT